MTGQFAERIICLTEETTETLYLLEEDWRIVGISGFTVRPPHARKEKPVISTFTNARIDEIVALAPDLVLGFSDIQADIASQLIAAGLEVHIFNQRTVSGILRMIRQLGALIGRVPQACQLAQQLEDNLQAASQPVQVRPRVYFEEWNDPLISGIGWVSELIEQAGGKDVFGDLAGKSLAKHRIIHDPQEVVRRNPDIIIGSWCGKPFRTEQINARCGWEEINAVRNQEIHEIDSSIILQPGPAALTDGFDRLQEIICHWRSSQDTKFRGATSG